MIRGSRNAYLVCSLCALPLLMSCGYHLAGTGDQIPEYIQTIHIDDFQNLTSRAQAAEFVTTAIRREFIRRSRLKPVDSSTGADSLLEGSVTAFDSRPLTYSEGAQANQFIITIRIDVKFLDLKDNRILYESQRLSFSRNYDISEGNFFAQETEALERIADDFAASTVSSILENF